MITIKDIAKYTGVSCTTVSNVIHQRDKRVSPGTIEKINHAIQELGYIPNMSARSLVSSCSKVIGFINHITAQPDNFMNDPFQSSIIGTIESVLRQNGYYLMLRTIETSGDLLSFLQTWNIDGLFFIGMFKDDFYDVAESLNIPMVLIDSYVRQPHIHNIGLEDFQGSYNATKYLVAHGHKKIAFASPAFRDGGVLQERFLGYKSALTEASIPFDANFIIEQEMVLLSAKQAGTELAALSRQYGVTACVVTADIMAAGMMAALKEQGLRIPEDISIVGFDDAYICQITTPTLTTIHQDIDKKANLAVKTMLQLLQGCPPSNTEIVLATKLIERESVRTIHADI